MAHHPTGQGIPLNAGVPEAAAAITPYRLVYVDSSGETATLSLTNAAATIVQEPLGIFVGGGSGTDGAAVDGDKGLDVRQGNGIPLVAGTGGLVSGEAFYAEYSATAANAGRGIGASQAAFLTNFVEDTRAYICGTVVKGAAAGDIAIVNFNPALVYFDKA